MRVLIIHDAVGADARPDEADTLAQSEAIAAALARGGHRVDRLAVGLDLQPLAHRITRGDIDVVFNSMESLGGHARLLAAAPLLAESMGIPVAGCRADAIHTTSNKPLAKSIMAAAGLPIPEWRTLAELREGRGLNRTAILKSTWEHSSVGLDDASVVGWEAARPVHAQARALADGLEARLPSLGGEGFAEAFIDGREFVVGLLPEMGDSSVRAGDRGGGVRALPPAEIVFTAWQADRPRLVGFAAKWHEETRDYATTVPNFDVAPEDVDLLSRLAEMARACWRLFDLRGHARVDFRIDPEGQPWILEVNANPCLTPGAGFSRMLDRAGIGYDEAIWRLVDVAMAGGGGSAATGGLPQASVSECRADVGSPKRGGDRCRFVTAAGVPFRAVLRPVDVDAVRQLVSKTGFFSDEEIAVAGELVEETLARGSEAGYEFLLADAEAGLAGYACFGRIPLTQASWDLYWIVVSPDAQGRGLGRALVDAVDARVARLGGERLYAETAGRAQYTPTRAFYERCGFSVAARLDDFYATGDDKVVYVRRVGI